MTRTSKTILILGAAALAGGAVLAYGSRALFPSETAGRELSLGLLGGVVMLVGACLLAVGWFVRRRA